MAPPLVPEEVRQGNTTKAFVLDRYGARNVKGVLIHAGEHGQLGCAGRHCSSRVALPLEAPRSSVIIRAPASPANSRPTKRGTRIGFFAPSCRASAGSQSATREGSSSTTLYTPRLPCSTAATVASAASATWTNDQTPPPLPTSGNLRFRISSNASSPGAIDVPGP